MQLLIVHDDAEVGEQLMSMLKDYTAHPCDLVESDAAAPHWAREHALKKRGFFGALRRN